MPEKSTHHTDYFNTEGLTEEIDEGRESGYTGMSLESVKTAIGASSRAAVEGMFDNYGYCDEDGKPFL